MLGCVRGVRCGKVDEAAADACPVGQVGIAVARKDGAQRRAGRDGGVETRERAPRVWVAGLGQRGGLGQVPRRAEVAEQALRLEARDPEGDEGDADDEVGRGRRAVAEEPGEERGGDHHGDDEESRQPGVELAPEREQDQEGR